ncbi:beta/alpha barrel domain-containing protein [Kineococcus sp. SYSU DK018]|uniref:indole-3-glycerol-phosphate synthase n=1 Tax=Kineococcus sp. SYSU DK018 TaxID=3383139 RepID=UPI003D7CB402
MSAGDFTAALLESQVPLVTEVKRTDADGRDLLAGRAPLAVVADYLRAGAPCLSVVTGRWFGGDRDLLRDVVRVSPVPVLQKDFFTRRSQVRRARSDGASAVLLTAQLLPREGLRVLVEAALEEGVTPFVEVVSAEEAAAVPHAGRCVVAVNNKDIRRRERDAADLDRSVRLLPDLLRAGTRCPVSASGITDPAAAARLLDHGFRGLLVGTAVVAGERLDAWADAVRREPVGVLP